MEKMRAHHINKPKISLSSPLNSFGEIIIAVNFYLSYQCFFTFSKVPGPSPSPSPSSTTSQSPSPSLSLSPSPSPSSSTSTSTETSTSTSTSTSTWTSVYIFFNFRICFCFKNTACQHLHSVGSIYGSFDRIDFKISAKVARTPQLIWHRYGSKVIAVSANCVEF
jgi:hypothetical protein